MSPLNPASIPLALYAHFPWCVRKCPYCDFNSHTHSGELPESAYVSQLIGDLSAELARVPERRISSVFFGGGTPSLISGRELARFLDALRASGQLEDDAEITLEANPGTVERQYFADYVTAGVNRFSLGVQSFNDHALTALGRIHNGDDVYRAWDLLQQLNVQRINIDLMHGLPEQTPAGALDDLHKALALDPGHLSWYQLTIEPNTVFYRQQPTLPSEDALTEIEIEGQAVLAEHGYVQYEISAYAKSGHDCRHNQTYWTFGDYLGVGAGAHGKITGPDGIWRTQRTRMPEHYLSAIDFGRKAQLIERSDLPFEYMLNALRLKQGTDHALFSSRTGLSQQILEPMHSELVRKGLMQPDRHALSDRGWWFYNDVAGAFLTT
ncbi:radical SAM family heme chaperone HemW [Salinispirillum sp. LH 10-3-1]|uniref:Heme chaperone HemW n=1 Tax=Salinispirillum sp. LH 10-3-1 TaxID=2952525 RepID=A0AB38YFT7_9GAMM